MFGRKSADPEHMRLLATRTAGTHGKRVLKQLMACEDSINAVIAEQKPLVLFGDPDIGITIVGEDNVTVVGEAGPVQSLAYTAMTESVILDGPEGVKVVLETPNPTEVIAIGCDNVELAQRLCSTVDPKIPRHNVKKRKAAPTDD